MNRLIAEIRHYFQQHPLSGAGIVAVSGGADSVALLRGLATLAPSPLIVAHLNHQLRGAESDADEQFAAQLATSLSLPFQSARIPLNELAAGENLEATARWVRYNWLGTLAADTGANWIATGHTADDQAETVLHRLIRGTGLQGLRGIARVKSLIVAPGRPAIIRPLLSVSRAEVLAYLGSLGQPYRSDSSNADPRFTRNRIRAELLPLIKTFNPKVVSVLCHLAEQADEAFALLRADAASLLAEVERPRAGELLILDAVKLLAAHPYRVREMLRLLWQREAWPIDRMTAPHWNRLVAVVQGELSAADFPGGVSARRTERVVQLGQRE